MGSTTLFGQPPIDAPATDPVAPDDWATAPPRVEALGVLAAPFRLLDSAVDQLQAINLDVLSDDAVLAALVEQERQSRRQASFRTRLVAQADRRVLRLGAHERSTAGLLRTLLQLPAHEARALEQDAKELTARAARPGAAGEDFDSDFRAGSDLASDTDQDLGATCAPESYPDAVAEPVDDIELREGTDTGHDTGRDADWADGDAGSAQYPLVARALARGEIGTAHARSITETLRQLPSAVSREDIAAAERELVARATEVDPAALRRDCHRLRNRLDPDGSLGSTAEERAAKRHFWIGRQDKTGMYPVSGLLDPEAGAYLRAALDPLAAPRPEPDGTPDQRTPEQRDHDALGELARRALAQGDKPVRHGCPVTVLLTMTLDELEARTGCVSTAHGGRFTVRDLLRMGADAGVIPVIMDSDAEILHFGEEQRLATAAQRRALQLLDLGCAYPGCATPGVWCETAHGEPFRTSRRTDLDDLALLCGYHHHRVDAEGWTIERHRGRAWLIPPRAIDPARTPRTNLYFKPLRPGETPPRPPPSGSG